MMYIFEGVDHSGKDTLIRGLNRYRSENQLPHIPMFDGSNAYDPNDRPPTIKSSKDFQKAIGWEIVKFCQQTQHDVVINRFTWSEIVYSEVLRGGADWHWYWDIMEEKLKDTANIIYVNALNKTIFERMEKSGRNKSQKVKDSIDDLKSVYNKLFTLTEIPSIMISTDTINIEDEEEMSQINRLVFGAK